MCSDWLASPMPTTPEKVTSTPPKRKTVLRKFAEQRSEDELSVSSHGTASVNDALSSSPRLEEALQVEVWPVDHLTLSGNGTVPDGGAEIVYVDPLQDVLTSSRNGSQICLNSSDQRKLSLAEAPLEDGLISPTLSGKVTALVTETVQEWKSLVPSQAQNVDQLFGLDELNKHLPNHRLRIFVGTWNVNGQGTFGNLRNFLFPPDSTASQLCDVYTIGIQEGLPEFKNWEVDLQKTIGLSHILFASEAVGTIHISIFIRRDLIWFCTKPLISRYHLRLINSKNSKGFVGVFFCLFGSSIMVMTSHLTAGHSAESLDVRIAQLNRIYREIVIPRSLEQTRGLINRFDAIDYVFWFGDFNFRLAETRKNVENTISELSSVQVEENGEHLQKLLAWDQLKRHKFTSIVHDFNEHPISFLPTYKFDLNSDHYDRSSKQRTPSYTDRILFRSNGPGNPITCRCYQSANEVKTSDHRPVYGVFEVKIRPQVRALPDMELCAGLFNRDVFTSAVGQLRKEQALKKAVGRTMKTSTVCSIL